jgi:hypothetical protein
MNPMDFMGVNNQTGLGPILTAMNSQRQSDLGNEQGLASMFQQQQAGHAQQLQNMENFMTAGGRIGAVNADNQNKMGASYLQRYEQFGQIINQLADSMEQMPPEARQQTMQNIAQGIPGIGDQPMFQQLLNTDPQLLPVALKRTAQGIVMNANQTVREREAQSQKDSGAMARTQTEQSGAMARAQLSEQGAYGRAAMSDANAIQRTQMGIDAQRDLEQMRIDAGKYTREKAQQSLEQALINADSWEKRAVALTTAGQLAAQNGDQQGAQQYFQLANEAQQQVLDQRTASATPATTLVGGQPAQVAPYGITRPPSIGGYGAQPQQQTAPVPAGLPDGTVNNGDGTFTLPDGRKVRPRQ